MKDGAPCEIIASVDSPAIPTGGTGSTSSQKPIAVACMRLTQQRAADEMDLVAQAMPPDHRLSAAAVPPAGFEMEVIRMHRVVVGAQHAVEEAASTRVRVTQE